MLNTIVVVVNLLWKSCFYQNVRNLGYNYQVINSLDKYHKRICEVGNLEIGDQVESNLGVLNLVQLCKNKPKIVYENSLKLRN